MLTEAQKVDIRRHLRYGPIGDLSDGGSFISYRFFVQAGTLEYRMNHLSAEEELRLTGNGDDNNPVYPHLKDATTGEIAQGYIGMCNWYELQIGYASDNFDIEKAGEYTARKDEMSMRTRAYVEQCMRMAQFLMLEINPVRIKAPNGGSMVA